MIAASGPTLQSFWDYAWEADDITGLTAGDPVTTWTDGVSSQAVTQATTSLKPIYRADPAVEFDGTDDGLAWASPTALNVMLTGATYTIAWAGRWDDYGGGVLGVPIGNTTSSAVRGCSLWLDGRAGQDKLVFAHNSSGLLAQTSAAISEIGDALYHTVVCVANGNSTQCNIYVDGAEVGAYTARPSIVAGATTFAEWRIGSATSSAFPYDGKTNGVYIAVDYAASAADAAAFHAYRIAKGTL